MKELPDGFQLHSGLDGLVVGLAIVFVVKVETVISSYVDWSQVVVVGKTLRGTNLFLVGFGEWARDAWSGFGTQLAAGAASSGGGGSGAASGGTGAAGSGAASGGVGVPVVGEAASVLASSSIKVVGFSIPLLGVGSASIIEQVLIILGVWIAILSPLYYWAILPGLSWWRKREVA